MAITLVASYYVQSSGTSSAAISTPSFTPSNGESIIVKAETWDSGTSMGTPTGGSQTYTQRVAVAPGGFRPWVGIFTATISGSPGSMTISSTPSASARYSILVERWTGAQFDATPATGSANAGSGAANGSLTTEADNSVISWVAGDAQAVDPATRAYLHSDTDEGLRDEHTTVDGVAYYAYYTAGAAGAATFGLSAPTGMQWCIAGIELQAAASGANLDAGNDAVAVAASAAALAVTAAAGHGAVTVAASSATLAVGAPAGNAALAVAGNAATLAVGAPAGGGALAIAAAGATLAAATSAGNAALSVAAGGATLQVSTAAGSAAVGVGAFDASLLYGTQLAAGAAAVSVSAFDVTLRVGDGTLTGNAHGPLALTAGAVIVHTGTIAGAVT